MQDSLHTRGRPAIEQCERTHALPLARTAKCAGQAVSPLSSVQKFWRGGGSLLILSEPQQRVSEVGIVSYRARTDFFAQL